MSTGKADGGQMEAQDAPDDLVSVPEAARTSGVRVETLYSWIRQGRVAVYPGRCGRLVSLTAVRVLVSLHDSDVPADAIPLTDALRLTGVTRRDLVTWLKRERLPRWHGRRGRLVRVADMRALAEHVAAGGDTLMSPDALLSREAARLSGLTGDRLYTWTRRGLLPAWRKAEGGQRVRLADVTALAERHGQGLPLKPGGAS